MRLLFFLLFFSILKDKKKIIFFFNRKIKILSVKVVCLMLVLKKVIEGWVGNPAESQERLFPS